MIVEVPFRSGILIRADDLVDDELQETLGGILVYVEVLSCVDVPAYCWILVDVRVCC